MLKISEKRDAQENVKETAVNLIGAWQISFNTWISLLKIELTAIIKFAWQN